MNPFLNPQPTNPGGLLASLLIKPTTRLHRLIVTNTNAAARYIQLFDAAALPPDGTVPSVLLGSLASGATQVFDFGIWGWPFANGIVVCNSTTAATKAIGSADSWFSALSS